MKIKTDTSSKPTVLLGIDFQNDFMEGGSLAVPRAKRDAETFARFLSKNRTTIDKVIMSLDAHTTEQIFHPSWWMDKKGKQPAPFTNITLHDVQKGTWIPVRSHVDTMAYLTALEKEGKKSLIIWPYHCLKETNGASITEPIASLLNELTTTDKDKVLYIEKGMNPISEMYGIVQPEYMPSGEDWVNHKLIEDLMIYPIILIGGEAKSHCVLESIRQIVHSFEKRGHNDYTIYVLQDCMSSITGYEEETEKTFQQLADTYPIILTNSHQLLL